MADRQHGRTKRLNQFPERRTESQKNRKNTLPHAPDRVIRYDDHVGNIKPHAFENGNYVRFVNELKEEMMKKVLMALCVLALVAGSASASSLAVTGDYLNSGSDENSYSHFSARRAFIDMR